jgi:histidine triad (HIT) family protein
MSTPTPPVDPDCLFCKIVAGAIPATIVARTDRVVAFRDINPQAPTHVLLIPVEHRPTAAATADADPAVVGELVAMAGAIARDEGIDESTGGHGYRLVFNTGPDSGQEVFHTHLHLLGGRTFTWPPG